MAPHRPPTGSANQEMLAKLLQREQARLFLGPPHGRLIGERGSAQHLSCSRGVGLADSLGEQADQRPAQDQPDSLHFPLQESRQRHKRHQGGQ